jgi:hypothetical protein
MNKPSLLAIFFIAFSLLLTRQMQPSIIAAMAVAAVAAAEKVLRKSATG